MANFGQFVLKELVVRGVAGAGQRAEFVVFDILIFINDKEALLTGKY